MNALIDLTKCREYLTITRYEQSHKIGLNGTIDTPYFCYKDVSDILGYKNSKDALYRHVDGDDKISLQELKKLVRAERTNFLGSMDHNNLSYHDGKAVYITETGLYSLILASQAPFAKEFKRLVCKTILPSIRKYGSYQVESQLTQAMEQLAIKEKSEEDLKREGEELRNKLVKAERKAIRVNKFMKRITIKERKMEWIYIATNDFYALERLWKVGSTIRLSSRIGGYHTGRAKGVGDGYSSFLTEGQKRLRSPAFAGRSTTMCLL
jgi:prophage antirepressor-like protein